MNTSTLPEPMAAYFAAEHDPVDMTHRVRLERGPVASLEMTA
jgi:hypothetical protein